MIEIFAFILPIVMSALCYYLGCRQGFMNGFNTGKREAINKIYDEFPHHTEFIDERTDKRIIHIMTSRAFSCLPEDEFTAIVTKMIEVWRRPDNVVKRNFPNIKEVKK